MGYPYDYNQSCVLHRTLVYHRFRAKLTVPIHYDLFEYVHFYMRKQAKTRYYMLELPFWLSYEILGFLESFAE